MELREKATILSIYISLYLCFLSIITGGKEVIILMAAVFSLPYYSTIVEKYHANIYWWSLLLLMVLGAALNILVAPNGLGGVIVIIGVFSTSFFICKNFEHLDRHFLLFILLFLAFVAYKVLYRGEDPNYIYSGRSRNYIGLVMALFNCIYSYIYYLKNGKPELIICFISLLLSLTLVGRTTMGVMAALFLFNLVTRYRKNKQFLFLIGLAVFVAAYYNWDDLEQYYKMSQFGGFGLDTPRYETWGAFINNTNIGTFIWGMDVTEVAELREYQGNPHNDFLNVLARTGMGALVLYLFYILSIVHYIYNRCFYFLVLLLIGSFRVFFDTGIFVNVLGISFYPIIFYPILNKGKLKHFK